jgi:putative phosphoribosyl transferase
MMFMQEWFSEGMPVQVPAGTSILDAELQVPAGATGLIVMIQAGGKPRNAQRMQTLAEAFLKEGFGILIMDLLTEEEAEIGKDAGEAHCFEDEMLDERLDDSLTWLGDQPETMGLPVGLIGFGHGARALFPAAAAHPLEISAMVAAGMDAPPATRALRATKSPALFIAGEQDGPESEAARTAYLALPAPKRIEIVPGCSFDREDTRATEKLARLACQWFGQHMV